VAAVGFELYCSLLDEAVEAVRAADGDGREPEHDAAVRVDIDVDAYIPGDYVPFEAAKIDVHRRIAAARETGELRALRDELADRFGSLPEPVESLLELQRARIELGRAGARTVEVRGGRLSAAPIELEGEQADAFRERLPQADYEWRSKTASVRVAPEPAARLAAALGLADALADAGARVLSGA